MSFPCFTHFMHDIDRPCVLPNRHIDGEPHNVQTFDPDRGEYVDVRPLRPCTGCLPRRAEYGLICWSCWQKLADALSIAVDMITHLRSITRALQGDNAGVRIGQRWIIPIPGSWRLADQLIVLLGHPTPGFPSDATALDVDTITRQRVGSIHPDSWVTLEPGAEAAIRFYRTMQTALRTYPRHEDDHRIQHIRCEQCGMRTLTWRPPLAFTPTDDNPDGRVRIICENERCGHEISREQFTILATMAELNEEAAGRGRRRAREPIAILSEACEAGNHDTCETVNCRCDCLHVTLLRGTILESERTDE